MQPVSEARPRRSSVSSTSTRWAFSSPLFNDSRPVALNPSIDAGLIALPWLPLRLLWRDPSRGEPLRDVVRIEGDAEGLLDEVANASAGPEIRRVAERTRAPGKPAQHGRDLSVGPLGHASQSRLARQSRVGLVVASGFPFLDSPDVSAEEVSELLGQMAVLETLNRQKATPFQFRRGSIASHAGQMVHSECQDNEIVNFAA